MFVIFDELLHFVNESNPTESFQKFVKYSVPVLIREIEKMLKEERDRDTGRRKLTKAYSFCDAVGLREAGKWVS